MKPAPRPLALALTLVALASGAPAQQQPDAAAGQRSDTQENDASMRGLALRVEPVLGAGCPGPRGELAAHLRNDSPVAVEGTLTLAAGASEVARTAFAVAPGGEVQLRLVLAAAQQGDGLRLVARSAGGRVLARQTIDPASSRDAVLLDATPQTRFAQQMQGEMVPDVLSARPGVLARLAAGIAVCGAVRDARTGAAQLPSHRLGWTGVTTTLLDTQTLFALPADERVALFDWVLQGGTLVLLPQRADELRHPTAQALLGAGVREQPAAASAGLEPSAWAGADDEGAALLPAPDTLRELRVFAGGNLHPEALAAGARWAQTGPLGAAARYGHGEVFVLGFDPTMPPALDDPWARQLVLGLAHRPPSSSGFVVREAGPGLAVPEAVRAALDPTWGTRSGLALALALLIAGAGLAGPAAFFLARRGAHPRRAGWVLGGASLALFGAVAGAGLWSRGAVGRVARLTVLELSAGSSRGPLLRYSAMYAEEAAIYAVEPLTPGAMLYPEERPGEHLVRIVDASRERIDGVSLGPVGTRVAREEGFASVHGAVGLERGEGGALMLTNHLLAPLRGVLVADEGGSAGWYLSVLGPGERRDARTGLALTASQLQALRTAPAAALAALPGADDARTALFEAAFAAVPTLWSAAPSGGPVLLAHFDASSDPHEGPFTVANDTVFLRVSGFGGAP